MTATAAFLPGCRLPVAGAVGCSRTTTGRSTVCASPSPKSSWASSSLRVASRLAADSLSNADAQLSGIRRCSSSSLDETKSEKEMEGNGQHVVFDPKSNMPEPPPEWKEKENERIAAMIEKQGVSIRRRPETGPPLHNVGAFQFKLQNAGNTPRNILEEIIWSKDLEVAQMKERMPVATLKKLVDAAESTRDFVGALRRRAAETGVPGLIAEVKKASPSRGIIQPNFDPVRIAKAYEAGGAACLSVLTDQKYFQGSFENLQMIRASGVQCPLLCKEFIIDAWQLYKARASGADAVLLISAVLPDQDLKYMSRIAKSLGLAVLIEVHSEREMDRVLALPTVDLVGINNRNLENFKVDIQNTVRLLEGERGQTIRDRGILVVGESGLFTPADIEVVQMAGCGAVLVGESLVKQDDPRVGIAGLFGKDISIITNPSLEVSAA
ncbi:hypothetical protein R1flu_025583 [Riccia fluitans]|uniref:indole-3-glycerol-phosphate synthase n=1 Tax=Riccia fluitans TaxID=41844 RepID=A0ABD1Y135_9MARC